MSQSPLVTIKKDEYLFMEGDQPDAMYIIKSGKIDLIVSDLTTEMVVASAGPGQLIGELALFDKKLRSASAKAAEDSNLIRLPYSQLEKDLEKMPEWVQSLMKKLAEKIREANSRILREKT